MNRLHILTLASLFLIACGAAPGTDLASRADALKSTTSSTTTKTTTSPTPVLALHTTSAEGTTVTWQTSYPLATTYDVFFATDVAKTMTGHYTLSLDVFMPGGGAYQTFTTAVAVGVAPAAGEVTATATSTGYRIWTTLPVAGTTISQYSLTGVWTATSYLGSATASTSFTLN